MPKVGCHSIALIIGLQNVQNLPNKIDILENFISDFSVDVLCLCEHWLSTDGLTSGLFNQLSDLTCVSAYCRTSYTHGGVSVFLKNNINHRIIDINSYCSEKICEVVAVELTGQNIIIVCFYRAPSDVQKEFGRSFVELEKCLAYLSKLGKNIILCGDFNVNILKNDYKSRTFLDLLRSVNLYPSISEPTRGNACLLNVMSEFLPSSFQSQITAGVADHDAVIFRLLKTQVTKHDTSLRTTRDTCESQLTIFKHMVSKIDWDEVLSDCDVSANIAFTSFFNRILVTFDTCFPVTYKKSKATSNPKAKSKILQDWYTSRVIPDQVYDAPLL